MGYLRGCMKNKILANVFILVSGFLISSSGMSSLNDSKENLLTLFTSGGKDKESAKKVSLDAQATYTSNDTRSCKKENIIYLSSTVKNHKYIELCQWSKDVYRYKYGKIDNPEIILFSNNVTREDIALGGFSFMANAYEYSVIEDNYKATLTVYKGEDVLTNIYLNTKTKDHINNTSTALPEKIY